MKIFKWKHPVFGFIIEAEAETRAEAREKIQKKLDERIAERLTVDEIEARFRDYEQEPAIEDDLFLDDARNDLTEVIEWIEAEKNNPVQTPMRPNDWNWILARVRAARTLIINRMKQSEDTP